MRPLGEHQGFPLLGLVGLDHPHPGERLGEPAGDLGVDLRALAEERAQGPEGVLHDEGKERQHAERDQGELGIEVKEETEGEDGGDHPSHHLDEAGAHEVADPLGVVHHAGEERARLGLLEIAHRETADVLLHLPAHLGDRALGRLAEHLGQRKRGDRLDDRRHSRHQHELPEELAVPLADHVVEQVFGGVREDQPREAVDRHQKEPQREAPLASPHEVERVVEHHADFQGGLLPGFVFGPRGRPRLLRGYRPAEEPLAGRPAGRGSAVDSHGGENGGRGGGDSPGLPRHLHTCRGAPMWAPWGGRAAT